MNTNVNLQDTVDSLDDIPLPVQQPCIEALNGAIVYQCNLDTNFCDKTAYVTGMSKFIEEAAQHALLNELLEQGNQHAIMLYTWRCCSRAIPQVQSNDQANRTEIYDKTVEVLAPHVNKLMQLMNFQKEAINAFCNEIKRLCHPKKEKEFVSESYLLTLGKFINMFAVLDELKNMKSSVKNDHSAYRRAAQFLRSDSYAGIESQNLSMFLATNDIIRTNLKKALEDPNNQITGYEEILADVINTSVQMFENRLYLLPQEKHILIKVIGFSLNLLDGETSNINKLDAKKRINLSKIDKIFRQYKVVPLYGDMQIIPFSYVMKTKNYDESKWPACNSSSEGTQGRILEHIEQIRYEHSHFITELAKCRNEMAIRKETKKNDNECRNLYTLALTGLKLLSKWTNIVLELYNWKLLHPADEKVCPKDSEDYERATRYNYNSQEKFAIVEVIAMIKGLQSLMFQLENSFKEAINHTTYCELQNFVQVELRDIIRKATSKKKDYIKSILLAVKNTCADWYRGKEPEDDPALKGKKDEKGSVFKIERPPRCIGPSSTQLYLVRTMLESLISERGNKSKKNYRKDLDQNHLEIIEKFHEESFFWSYLLNLSESLYKCCDLSQMWYREFFLEMTMGRQKQFPIEMSIPWILTSHILDTKDQSMMEYVFYPLDLYNDAAINALTVFKKRHLYDEVEAEVNLCFDQFVYRLSDQIYRAFKQTSANILLEKKFRDDFNKIHASFHNSSASNANTHPLRVSAPNTSRYEILMRQRHIQLLGRSINLSKLIAQRINSMLLNNIKTIISKFESNDLTSIIELDSLMKLHKMTHKLISKHLVLDDFEALFKEADYSVSSSYGRTALHIVAEITSDVLPNYCYNSSTRRFVLTKFKLIKDVSRDEPPTYQAHDLWGSKAIHVAYQSIHSLYTGFIGQPHIKCVNKYLGYQGIALIISEFLKFIESLIKTSLTDYLVTINRSLKKINHLPRYEYGSNGLLEFYYENLANIIKYAELPTNVFHLFTQVGNTLLFSLMLEQELSIEEVSDLVHASIFLNWLPKVPCKENESMEVKMQLLEQKYASIQIVKIIERFGTEKQKDLVHEGELLTRERLCCGLSIFEYVLMKTKTILLDSKLAGNASNTQIYQMSSTSLQYDDNIEFHKLWSAMQFVFCMPKQGKNYLAEELFGDGLLWAGCTFIALLGQQCRFEIFDHSYHLLKVNQTDGKSHTAHSISLEAFVNRIRRHQIMNNEIFSVINRYLKGNEPETIPIQNIQLFHPPAE